MPDSAAAGPIPDMHDDARRVAALALAEDGKSDVTTDTLAAAAEPVVGVVEYRDGGTVAGTLYAAAVAEAADCTVEWTASDGAAVGAGSAIGRVRGSLAAVLRAERPMLNLLQRACGIATATRAYVDAVGAAGCSVLHTRKTAPGLRGLDVSSVLAGGGGLHRLDLAGELLFKDNHWLALERSGGELGETLKAARRRGVTQLYVEVESLEQLEEACRAGATRLLIDNQPPETLRSWVEAARGLRPGIEVEASGGITLDNVREYAEAGVDYVSIGALTHSVAAADVALELSAK
jgi:nicotinate-nucleotide pyrophosphorylase (carboxylating)